MTTPANGIPTDRKPLEQDGRFKLEWYNFLQELLPYITPQVASYTVAGLPSSAGAAMIAFASDGRKPSEGAGHGTGMLVFFDGSHWISVSSGATITS